MLYHEGFQHNDVLKIFVTTVSRPVDVESMVKALFEAPSPNPESPFSFKEDHEAKRRVQFQFYWRREKAKHVHARERPT